MRSIFQSVSPPARAWSVPKRSNHQFRDGSFTRITRSAATSLSSCTIPEGHRISIRLADAAGPSPKCVGAALDDAYPAANETWPYCNAAACRHLDSGADTVAVAGRTFQLQFQPMRTPGTVVQPQLRRRAQSGCYHVQAAIGIQVSHRGSAMPRGRLRRQTRFLCQRLKLRAAQVAENRVRLIDLHLRS